MGGVKFSLFWSGRDGASAYIVCMDTILPILLGLAMLATLGVLCAGVIAFAFNTKANAKYSNKLMTARVICQAVAVAIFGVMVLLHII
jgi:Hypoxia induced protein conserved region